MVFFILVLGLGLGWEGGKAVILERLPDWYDLCHVLLIPMTIGYIDTTSAALGIIMGEELDLCGKWFTSTCDFLKSYFASYAPMLSKSTSSFSTLLAMNMQYISIFSSQRYGNNSPAPVRNQPTPLSFL